MATSAVSSSSIMVGSFGNDTNDNRPKQQQRSCSLRKSSSLRDQEQRLNVQIRLLEKELQARKASNDEADQARVLQLEITLIEHQIARKGLLDKLKQQRGGNSTRRVVRKKKPLNASAGSLSKNNKGTVGSMKSPGVKRGLTSSSKPKTNGQENALPNHQTGTQSPANTTTMGPRRRRGTRKPAPSNKLASILNRFEQTIQQNERRGENADRFLKNMASNPQLRGRALVARSRHQTSAAPHRGMIRTAGMPRHLLQDTRQPRSARKSRQQQQPFRFLAPNADASSSRADQAKLQRGKQVSAASAAAAPEKSLCSSQKKAGGPTSQRMGSLKLHLNRNNSSSNNKRTTDSTSLETSTTARTSGSKSTLLAAGSMGSSQSSLPQKHTLQARQQLQQEYGQEEDGSYSLYEEYTEYEEEGSYYTEEIVPGEDSFMEETVGSETPSKSNLLYESWASYEEEEIVYDEELDEETLASYTYSLVDKSRDPNGDSIASLQSELEELRNEWNQLQEDEDFEDISLHEDEHGNLVMPMNKVRGMHDSDYTEEELLESIREEDDEPITLFLKSDDNPTPNDSNAPGVAVPKADDSESGSYQNSDSQDDQDEPPADNNGGDDSSFSLSVHGKEDDASSMGSVDPLQPVEKQQPKASKTSAPSPRASVSQKSLPSTNTQQRTSEAGAGEAPRQEEARNDEEGYYGNDGTWHWYADEGYYDDQGTWRWYENEGYYDNDGYWHWWENEGYYDDQGTWQWYENENAEGKPQASGEGTGENDVPDPPSKPSAPDKTMSKTGPVPREPAQTLEATSNPAGLGGRKDSKRSSSKRMPPLSKESPPPESKSTTTKTLVPPPKDSKTEKQQKPRPGTNDAQKKSFRRVRGLAKSFRNTFGRKRRQDKARETDVEPLAQDKAQPVTNGYGAKPHYYKEAEKDKISRVRKAKAKSPSTPQPKDEVPARIDFVYDWIMDRYVPQSVPMPNVVKKPVEATLPAKSTEEEVCIEFMNEDESENVDYGYEDHLSTDDEESAMEYGDESDSPLFCPMTSDDSEDALAMLVKKGRYNPPKRQLSQHSASDGSVSSDEEEEYWGSQVGFSFDPKELEDDNDVIPLLKHGGPLGPTRQGKPKSGAPISKASTSTRRGGRRKSLDESGSERSGSMQDSKSHGRNSMHGMPLPHSLTIDEGDEDQVDKEEEENAREMFRQAHKEKGFADIVREAASLGRLTRLGEKVVEASGRKAAPVKSRRASVVATNLLDIQWNTTHHGNVCNDIVEIGQMYRGNEVITESQHNYRRNRSTSSFDSGWSSKDYTSDSDDWDEFGGDGGDSDDEGPWNRGNNSQPTTQIDGVVQRVKELDREKNTKMVQHLQNQNPDEIELPATAPPRAPSIVRRHQSNPRALRRRSMGTIKKTLTEDVIQKHSEREARVGTGKLHMKGQCDCPYCYTASPYQTYAYKKAVENKTGGPSTWVRQNGQWSRSQHD